MTDNPRTDHTRRLRIYQFVAFMMLGVVNLYMSPFLKSRGLTDTQLGWVQLLLFLPAAFVPPLWGMFADSVRDRRLPIVLAVTGAATLFTSFYFTHSFWPLLLVALLFAACFRGIAPMGTSLIFAYAETRGLDYSRIRLFGTAGYVVSILLLYFPMRILDITAIFPSFLVFALAAVTGLLALPPLAGAAKRRLDWSALSLFGRGNFPVYVICAFLAQAAMASHYVFFPLYVLQLGVPRQNLVFFYAFASVLELAMLFYTGRLIQRFGTRTLMLLGLSGVVLRLVIYATCPVVWVLFLSQGLHALTMAAVHAATVTFVNYASPMKWRSSAQTLFEGVTIGLAGAAGAGLGGLISQTWGYQSLFAWSALVAGLALMFFTLRGKSVDLVRVEDRVLVRAESEE